MTEPCNSRLCLEGFATFEHFYSTMTAEGRENALYERAIARFAALHCERSLPVELCGVVIKALASGAPNQEELANTPIIHNGKII